MKKSFLLFVVVGIVWSCSSDNENQTQPIDMRINHYQNTGLGEGLYLTLMVQEGNNIGTDQWSKFYSTIEGFNFEPGYVYDLSVQVDQIDNPPADGSSLKYTLDKIKSTKKVDNETLFVVDLKIDGQSFITTTSGYEILNKIKVDCNTICDELDEKILAQDDLVGTFKRIQGNDIQLISLE